MERSIETRTEDGGNSNVRKRHGFTTFCLMFGLVLFAIMGVFSFSAGAAVKVSYNTKFKEFQNVNEKDLILHEEEYGGNDLEEYQEVKNAKFTIALSVFNGIVSLAFIIGFVLLLRWKKIGFWIIVGLSIISILILPVIIPKLAFTGSMTKSDIFSGIVTRVITVAIIWGVLQIRKNGKNTWKQLESISKYGWF
jgi:hypothetical protein